MKLGRCPVCHHHVNLEAVAQDEAAREMMAVVARLTPAIATSCLSYLGLFRPFKSDLNNGRALRLLTEVLDMTNNSQALCQALDQTVSNIANSRNESGDSKPLSNHKYLTKVLTSIQGWDTNTGMQTNAIATRPHSNSKSAVSSAILDIEGTDWANSHES